MQKDYNNKDDQVFDPEDKINLIRQKCVRMDQFRDEEIADEFYILAPVDANDLYNQN